MFLKLLVPVALAVSFSCTMGPAIKDGMTFGAADTSKGNVFVLDVERGPNFMHDAKIGIMNLRITPQIAIWLEDSLGAYLGTVYVTKCFGKQQWKMAKPHPDSCLRSTCMPYWLNRFKAAGNHIPTPNTPLPDAVCGATPTGSFSVSFTVPDSVAKFKVLVEWNSSFDNNETFTKESASFNGQPSVVASALVNNGDSAGVVTLVNSGRGGALGSDPKLYDDLDKITTARSIFGTMSLRRK